MPTLCPVHTQLGWRWNVERCITNETKLRVLPANLAPWSRAMYSTRKWFHSPSLYTRNIQAAGGIGLESLNYKQHSIAQMTCCGASGWAFDSRWVAESVISEWGTQGSIPTQDAILYIDKYELGNIASGEEIRESVLDAQNRHWSTLSVIRSSMTLRTTGTASRRKRVFNQE